MTGGEPPAIGRRNDAFLELSRREMWGDVYALIDGARHPLPEWMVEPITDQLEAMALDIYRGERDDALERRAEARRDDAMLDRVPAHVTRAAE